MPADLLLVNARVRTLDPARPFAGAVAARDGVIVAVGDEAVVREEAGGAAEVLDLGGAALVPGLADAHVHPFHGTDSARGVDLRGARDLDEIRRRLAAGAAALSDGEWLLAAGAPYEPFAQTGIDARLVEDLAGGRPVVVRFYDGHTVLASRAALAAAGIDGPREFVQRSEIVCDAGGRPTGELREWAAIGLLAAAVPPPADRLGEYAATLRAMNANGLVGGHVMLGRRGLFDDVARLEDEGRLSLRLRVPCWLQPETSDEEIEGFIAELRRRGRRWQAGVAKFFADGVVETGTAWLHGGGARGRNDEPFWPVPGSYAAAVRRMAGAGFQCVTHSVGDGAVRAALDAYAAAPRAASGAPHRVEHLETLRDEELARLAREGVAASMQPLHIAGLDEDDPADAWRAGVGDARLPIAFRWADVRRSGAILALGSDWPVADHDPRAGMAWARLRREPGRRDRTPFFAAQALTALQALEGYTTQAALAAGEQDVSGRIAPGYRADLTALGEDPVDCDADDLPDVPVVLTVVDGEVVFRAA
jgi:predicted amidohydrolase YtcJ